MYLGYNLPLINIAPSVEDGTSATGFGVTGGVGLITGLGAEGFKVDSSLLPKPLRGEGGFKGIGLITGITGLGAGVSKTTFFAIFA
jgi:hypothetical protein